MNIALVILHADPARGGAERYTLDLAAALADRGHRVSLLATTFSAVPAKVLRVALDALGMTRVGRYERFLDSLDAHVAQTPYDIVHAMLPVRRCDIYHPHAGLAATAVITGSTVSTLFNPRRARFAWIERALLRSPNPPVVLCLSDYLKQPIRGLYPLDGEHLPTLFNAVDLRRFDAGGAPGEQKHPGVVSALMIAQDYERKGLRELIHAIASVAAPALRLDIVGKQRAARYQRLATAMGVRNRVRFHGPTGDTYPFYRSADFFVLPTKHDPCSLVVLEALAMALPVISTRFNGACEIMTDGVHGFVLPDPSDVDALADAMRKMLDPRLRAKMSQACLELRPKLSYENHLRTLLGIYRQVVESKASRADPVARTP